jgi:phosphoglycerate kinase
MHVRKDLFLCIRKKIKQMITIDDINFGGKRALIRVDFNVPLNSHREIADDTRIMAALPTINKILDDGGSVILMSHLGRPKNGPEDRFSLKNVQKYLSKKLHIDVKFVDDCIGAKVEKAANELMAGEVLMLENLRFYAQETAGTESFAEELSKLGDVYVNDAFGTAHRSHASTAVIAKFFPNSKCFGYVMANEIENIDKVLKSAERPLTAIMGGAKVSSKISIIERLLPLVDKIIIGGGMSYTFAKAHGGNIGMSLVETDYLATALNIEKLAKEHNVELLIPVDSVNANKFENEAETNLSSISDVPDGFMGLDIGAKTEVLFAEAIKSSKTILWNGPMGVFEMDNFSSGTKAIADAVVEATNKGAFSLVGGGDSVAAVKKYAYENEVSYVSTGGGAMLEYLEGVQLPGIKAILEG